MKRYDQIPGANKNGMWTGRAQRLLEIIRATYGEAIPSGVTPTRLISLLHAEDVTAQVKSEMHDFFAVTPGFQKNASSQGLYHYTFLVQLEHLCDGFQDAYAHGLIK